MSAPTTAYCKNPNLTKAEGAALLLLVQAATENSPVVAGIPLIDHVQETSDIRRTTFNRAIAKLAAAVGRT